MSNPLKDAYFHIETVPLSSVIEFWAKEYKIDKDGNKVLNIEHFIDPFKGVVIFKLLIERESTND